MKRLDSKVNVLDSIRQASSQQESGRARVEHLRDLIRQDQAPREQVPRVNGKFAPGASGNRLGRPKGVVALCKEILERSGAYDFLEDVSAGLEDVGPELRTKVIMELMNRAHGRAMNVNLNASAEVPPEQLAAVLGFEQLPVEQQQNALSLARSLAALESGKTEEKPEDAEFEPV